MNLNFLIQKVHLGDCLIEMGKLPENSIDSIITDPPYGLSFMGKHWDYIVPQIPVFKEMLRVLKPGGHLLCFGGSRTFHRIAVNIEDAGFDIRDTIMWLYGSGFPKSHDVSKGIDKQVREKRVVVGRYEFPDGGQRTLPRTLSEKVGQLHGFKHTPITSPASAPAKQWWGWGTALKPAFEPICVARKPFSGTIADNVLKWGTGALNIDGCRVGTSADMNPNDFDDSRRFAPKFSGTYNGGKDGQYCNRTGQVPNGRWPANVIHDGSPEVLAGFPDTGPSKASIKCGSNPNPISWGKSRKDGNSILGHNDLGGSTSRFFYCAKASKKDRDDGLSVLDDKERETHGTVKPDLTGNSHNTTGQVPAVYKNNHPTVKPSSLMKYLCRLVTPHFGIILDPYAGSGSTGKAALLESFRFIGFEREKEYVKLANKRLEQAELFMTSLEA